MTGGSSLGCSFPEAPPRSAATRLHHFIHSCHQKIFPAALPNDNPFPTNALRPFLALCVYSLYPRPEYTRPLFPLSLWERARVRVPLVPCVPSSSLGRSFPEAPSRSAATCLNHSIHSPRQQFSPPTNPTTTPSPPTPCAHFSRYASIHFIHAPHKHASLFPSPSGPSPPGSPRWNAD